MSCLLFCMVMLLASSCQDSIIPDENKTKPPGTGGENELVPVALNLQGLFGDENSPSTYSLTDIGDAPGSGPENTITDVTVFVFNSSLQCEKIMQGVSPAYNPVGPELVRAGQKRFIAVVNGVGKLTPMYGPGDEALVTYNGLRQQLTNATTALPTSPFLMTGETTETLASDRPASTPNEINIQVKRAVAKVKMSFVKSGDAASHNITMQSVTLHQGSNKIYLLQKPMPLSGVSYNLSSTKSTFSPSAGTVPLSSSLNPCLLADTFYTYETLCGSDKSKAVYFELTAAVNSPANIRTARVYLAEDPLNATDTVYDVKRNHWYNVKVNFVDPGMDSVYVELKAAPWNTVAPIDTTVGAGAVVSTAEPLRLVKSYTSAELASDPSVARIDKHTKGASWIDLKVTDNTPWTLEFNTDNTAGNSKAFLMYESGGSWVKTANMGTLSQTGDGTTKRIYVYRPWEENNEPEKGVTLSLKVNGNFKQAFVVQPRDTTPIPTNCYILRPENAGGGGYGLYNRSYAFIPLKGVYRYWEDFLMANGDSIPDGTITTEITWQDRAGDILRSSSLEVLNADQRDSAYIYAEAGDVQGNAVVSMKVGGTIYWSFHLWVTEYNPYEQAGEKPYAQAAHGVKEVFMDRNLGALANIYDAAGEANGLFYQYGRKDPFPGGTNWTTTPKMPITTGSAPTASTAVRPKTALPAALKNPTTFYNVSGNTTWPFYEEDKNLWYTAGGNKTAYDPCPEGWRVPQQNNNAYGPTSSPWHNIDSRSDTWYLNLSSEPEYQNGRISINDSTSYPNGSGIGYYPFSGYIQNNGVITAIGTAGFYGSAWTSGKYRTGLRIEDSSSSSSILLSPTTANATGVSVRCVVDRNYIKETSPNANLFGDNKAFLESFLN